MNTWNPRQEILSIAHRWYWFVASFLLGALLGWLVSMVWPAPARATLDLYVGLNAYRASQDEYIAQAAGDEFSNLDDFKHWQMSQLNSLALSDEYLSVTLEQLQIEDPAWSDVDLPALRAMLSIAWRNTGDWHFSAENHDVERASQAVTAWTTVVTGKVGQAVDAARQVVLIDSQLKAVSDAWVAAETRRQLLLDAQPLLAAWASSLDMAHPDQPLSPRDHWNLLSLAAAVADFSAGWQVVLEAAPSLGALPTDYAEWLPQVEALIGAELALLPGQIAELEDRHAELSAAYQLAADESQALSATLEVGPLQDISPRSTELRPVGSLLLIGGLLGVLALGLGWLVQITRKTV